MKKLNKLSREYLNLIADLQQKIIYAQQRSIIAVNKEMILLYWDIGKSILEQQKKHGWGAKIIDNLSKDLTLNFPEMKGFPPRNLKYMRKFANTYSDNQFVQEVLAQMTWYHNLTLMEKVTNIEERKWYIQQTIQNGWSRNVLVHQIESNLYKRQVIKKKTTNFDKTLTKPQSELAKQTLKDPYIFDFLTLNEPVKEKDIENQLLKHITRFLLELGAGFTFIGNQYHLEVGNNDYYIDLLLCHLKLKCFVAIELKTGEFKPEYAGKINFYLSALDDLIKTKTDNPSIGIVLCKNKNKIVAEYALRDMSKPIGITEYKLMRSIPKQLKSNLPSLKELETELRKIDK